MTAEHDQQTPPPSARRRLALVAAALGVTIAAGVALIGTGTRSGHTMHSAASSSTDAVARAHTAPREIRTLVVSRGAEPQPSVAGAAMHGLRIAGALPSRAVVATVLTDENCAPDRAGVSHCRNTLRLPSGAKLTVRHPHRMMDVPCMTPGEHVRVTRAA